MKPSTLDKLVCGILNSGIQKRYLSEAELSLKNCPNSIHMQVCYKLFWYSYIHINRVDICVFMVS